MPLTEAQIDDLVQRNPFLARSSWRVIAREIERITEELPETYFPRLQQQATVSLGQLAYILKTPDELLFMSHLRRLAAVNPPANTDTNLFQSPANKHTLVKQITLVNDGTGTPSIRLYLIDAGGSVTFASLIPPSPITLAANKSTVVQLALKLLPGQRLAIRCTTNTVAAQVFGVN